MTVLEYLFCSYQQTNKLFLDYQSSIFKEMGYFLTIAHW